MQKEISLSFYTQRFPAFFKKHSMLQNNEIIAPGREKER